MRKKVELVKIQVDKLFGRFNYDIDVRNEYGVSILIAPNGCGKTTIFNLVNFILSPSQENYQLIAQTPFEKCICFLSNGCSLSINVTGKKEKRYGQKNRLRFAESETEVVKDENIIMYSWTSKREKSERMRNEYSDCRLKEIESYIHMLNHELVLIEKNHENGAVDQDINVKKSVLKHKIEELQKSRIEAVFESELRNSKASEINANDFESINKKLLEIGCKIDVRYIMADRLHTNTVFLSDRQAFDREKNADPLMEIQKQAKQLYRQQDLEYKEKISAARDSLPRVFLNAHNDDKIEYTVFEQSWNRYLASLEKYYELGLLETNETILDKSELKRAFKDNAVFLSVYLEVFKGTLDVWKEEYPKMKLFVDTINRRNAITGKNIKFGPDGLEMTVMGEKIPLSSLSSGEKNDLIMFYNLIFMTQKGGVVLVDEPEISLHIQWQEEYLDCLLDICKLNNLQAIVATHSPNIVNGHFELYAKRDLKDEYRRD